MNTNFIAIGRIPAECIFIHKDDVEYLKEYGFISRIKCIAIDFEKKRISKPVIIDTLLKFCPHEDICSAGERSVIDDLVSIYFCNSEILDLNKKFEKIKLTKGQTEKGDEHQSGEPRQIY